MFKLFDTDNSLTLDEFELVEILESQYIAPLLHKWTRTLTWEHFLQRIAMRGLGFGVSRQQAHRQNSQKSNHSASIHYMYQSADLNPCKP